MQHAERGVTLVELVVVIVVTGILFAMISMFVRNQVTSYTDTVSRTELADQADIALRRIARDLQSALPNSVRVNLSTADCGLGAPLASGGFLELLPIRGAGRYRAEQGTAPADDPLSFGVADTTFDVLGPAVAVSAGDNLVIYNNGGPGACVYEAGAGNRRTLVSGGATITFAAGAALSPMLRGPGNRFHVVNTPVSYACDLPNATLWRYSGYAMQASQPTSVAALDALAGVTKAALATDVSACSFTYQPGYLMATGLVVMRVQLTRNGETVDLLHQVGVVNTP